MGLLLRTYRVYYHPDKDIIQATPVAENTHSSQWEQTPINCTTRSYQQHSLDTALKSIRNTGPFKNALRQSMFTKSVGILQQMKSRSCTATYTNSTRPKSTEISAFAYGIVPTPTCQMCQTGNDETPSHYFLKCPKYAASRQGLLLKLTPILDRLNINTNNTFMLLKLITGGHPTLSFKENLNVVNLVQEYIFSTKRF